jgi:hypothetical protein
MFHKSSLPRYICTVVKEKLHPYLLITVVLQARQQRPSPNAKLNEELWKRECITYQFHKLQHVIKVILTILISVIVRGVDIVKWAICDV